MYKRLKDSTIAKYNVDFCNIQTAYHQITMIQQPIVDLSTGKSIAVEMLCRPKHQTVSAFFQSHNGYELWQKELLCIQEGLKKKSNVPKMFNLTISSLPYFLETDLRWVGGIELVEWGPRPMEIIKDLPDLIMKIKERDMTVWIDDLTYDDWTIWKDIKSITGYKITVAEIGKNPMILDIIKKSIIVECIENREIKEKIMNLGIKYGQGYYFY